MTTCRVPLTGGPADLGLRGGDWTAMPDMSHGGHWLSHRSDMLADDLVDDDGGDHFAYLIHDRLR